MLLLLFQMCFGAIRIRILIRKVKDYNTCCVISKLHLFDVRGSICFHLLDEELAYCQGMYGH